MNRSNFLYIANLKNYFTFAQTKAWVTDNKNALRAFGAYNLVLCPSLEVLGPVASILAPLPFALGAQDCSAHSQGPFTGQILAESLAQIGCTYALINHPEQVAEYGFMPQKCALKIDQLAKYAITPIICISESPAAYDTGAGQLQIQKQLSEILHCVTALPNRIIIAYEPTWVTSSNTLLDPNYVNQQLFELKKLVLTKWPHTACATIYGGGVDQYSIQHYKAASNCDGVLIGKASTDFQNLEKIVLFSQ